MGRGGRRSPFLLLASGQRTRGGNGSQQGQCLAAPSGPSLTAQAWRWERERAARAASVISMADGGPYAQTLG